MRNDCLNLLREVREAAASADEAYVIRSRIGRLMVGCLRMAARSAGAREPEYPHRFELSDAAPAPAVELVRQCNEILDTSRRLVQPSEPLDSRWQTGWSRVNEKLELLESHLKEFSD